MHLKVCICMINNLCSFIRATFTSLFRNSKSSFKFQKCSWISESPPKTGSKDFFPGKGYRNPEISRATCTSQRYLMVIFGFAIMHQLAISARTNCKGNRWWQCRGARWDEIENLPKFELCDKSLHLLLQFFISEIRQFPRNPSYSASAGKQIY